MPERIVNLSDTLIAARRCLRETTDMASIMADLIHLVERTKAERDSAQRSRADAVRLARKVINELPHGYGPTGHDYASDFRAKFGSLEPM